MTPVHAVRFVVQMADRPMLRTDQFLISREIVIDALDLQTRAAFGAFALGRGSVDHQSPP